MVREGFLEEEASAITWEWVGAYQIDRGPHTGTQSKKNPGGGQESDISRRETGKGRYGQWCQMQGELQ